MPQDADMAVRITNSDWRIDPDGFLRITARILQAGVYPYSVAEMPQELQAKFPGVDKINQRIDAAEFTPDALASLEGKPVIIDMHDWRDPDNTLTDGLTAGNVAGTPTVDGGSILCDLLIIDPNTIRAIQGKKLVEVSAAYDSQLAPDDTGAADVVQRNPLFNHILLLPEGRGRCGPNVRILNAKEPTMIELTIGERRYRFENEKDAEEAKKMAADSEAQVKNSADEAMKVKNASLDEHINNLKTAQAALAEATAKATAAEEALKAFASEEAQESAATEREGLKGDSEAVMNAEPEGEKKEALKAAIGNCKTLNEKVKTITMHVLNSRGIEADKMNDGELKVAFKTLAATAKTIKPEPKPFMPKARIENSNGNQPQPKSWRD